MSHFFQKRDPWGNSVAIWILAVMVFIAPLVVSSMRNLRMQNDVESWLPKDDPQAQLLDWYRGYFPHEDQVIISWEGSTLEDPRVDAFAQNLVGTEDPQGILRDGSPYFKAAITPKEAIANMLRQDVESDEALRRMYGVLIGKGALKIELTELGSKQTEKVQQQLLELLNTELGIQAQVLPSVSQWKDQATKAMIANGVRINVTQSEDDAELDWPDFQIADHDFQISWTGMQRDPELQTKAAELCQGLKGRPIAGEPEGSQQIKSAFYQYGSPVGIMVQLSASGTEVPQEAVQAIRDAALKLAIDPRDLHLAGSTISATTLNEYVVEAAWNKSAPVWQLQKRSVILLSGVVGAVLAFLTLKSIRLGILVLFTSYYATLVVVSLVPATGGTMNMVLIVMPTLLAVLTLSGAIHLANYWKHASFANAKCATSEAVRMAAAPCLLASATTAIGLASLLTSNLTPVRDFGLYSAIGTGVSLLFILYGLPALLQLWPAQSPNADEIESVRWRSLASVLTRHHAMVSGVCLLLFGFSIYGLQFFRTETKVIRYFPDDSQIVNDYRTLEDELTGVISVDTIVRFDATAQKETQFSERIEIVREVSKSLSTHNEVTGSVSLATFQPVSEPLTDELKGYRRSMYIRRSSEVQRTIKDGESPAANRFVQIVKNASKADPLNSQHGDELWRITSQASIMSDIDYGVLTSQLNEKVQSVLLNHPGTSHVVTGMVPIFLRTQQAVLESLIVSFGLAFGIIAIVMMILLKNSIAGLITMLPNLLPVGLVFGTLAWINQPVDIGTMITASVALGIAVDGTLHLLTWFRNGLAEGKTINESIELSLAHCGPAMWQTSMIVAISLLMLAPCNLLLVSRFGILMAALITAALVADVIYLPALLAGPLGRLIQSTVKVNPVSEEPEVSSDASHGIDHHSVDDLQEVAAIPITSPQLKVVQDVTRKSAN